ncbi:MAG: prolyl oligopeptidase family serine peptidase [Candidatus Niyogibacteria bacterium]|nr:prolyl oligopeptidase family serine peptidase [Candidatus Niyogibacteria bacterium]
MLARIRKDIVCEFLPPVRRSRKVIILCGGMPSYPSKRDLLFFLSKKGYWVFSLRYRGSWESGGSFLKKSPHQDVLDVIRQLSSGFKDLWSGKVYKIRKPEVYVIGVSFGGPAAILASKSPKIKKSVVFSPVVDWDIRAKRNSVDWMRKFVKSAFGSAYRFKDKDWEKLKSGKFYSPAFEIKNLDAQKIFIIHAKDDRVVYSRPVEKFARELGCKFLLLKKGGHLSSSNLMEPEFWRKISAFLR